MRPSFAGRHDPIPMLPAVLFVDDEPHVLDTIRRQLRHQFSVTTAGNEEEAIAILRAGTPFGVIVADYRMPGGSGVDLLARARELAPDTVRVVMAGRGDMAAAVEAINEGHIFRCLTRPCPTVTLVRVLQTCVAQHHLQTSERELLEKTLSGSVKVLADILSLVSPDAFGRANRLKECVSHLVRSLELPQGWEYEVAALLSQIGCVTLPVETLGRMLNGLPLSVAERDMVRQHPVVAQSLLAHVPRLETVGEMIARQNGPLPPGPATRQALLNEPRALLGARLLHLALAVDQRALQGMLPLDVMDDLLWSQAVYGTVLVDALEHFVARKADTRVEEVFVRDLNALMVLDEDVRTAAGLLLVSRGQHVTGAVIQRLRTFAQGVGISEPLRVRIPEGIRLTHPVEGPPGIAATI